MSDLIKIIGFVLCSYFVFDYMKEHNLTLVEMFTTFPNRVTQVVHKNKPKINLTRNTQVSNQENYQKQKEIVIVRALGDVEYSDITDACNIIKDFYGYNCVIGQPEPITSDLYISGTDQIINAEVCLNKFFTKNKVVYIVDKRLWASGDFLKGYAATNGGFVIVRGDKSTMSETLIHEIGHTLGLSHCDDLSCIMAIKNDKYETGRFCNKCRNKISHFFN